MSNSDSTLPLVDPAALLSALNLAQIPLRRGRVTKAFELHLEAYLPGVRVGTRVEVRRPGHAAVPAEVASCDGQTARLLLLAAAPGLGIGDEVVSTAERAVLLAGNGLLGRIVDPLGFPADGRGPLRGVSPWPVSRPAPDPLARQAVREPLTTFVRSIDGCLTLGRGQRIGLFSGPGLGKSTLLALLARRSSADFCVICLVGERGREVREFIDGALGEQGRARSAIVLAPADAPAALRALALETATAIAERFREDGKQVLLLVDSLTRVVRAQRDVALALGEAPVRAGFPASSFAALPGLLERAGNDARGSITAVYAVLTEGGADDPVAEEVRSLLDGHIVLSHKLAKAGRYPAIDLLASISRVMRQVAGPKHLTAAQTLVRMLGALAENEDLILMGAYRKGTSPDTDLALLRRQAIDVFLCQGEEELSSFEDTVKKLRDLTSPHPSS